MAISIPTEKLRLAGFSSDDFQALSEAGATMVGGECDGGQAAEAPDEVEDEEDLPTLRTYFCFGR